ncbi:GGDEF domain-containing protein [Parerythrobacter lacustris]|uniref:diguanylate cyclase n=1 Tax=Parerythrobacter lacustris TaxID=2969984 RepID=A0ABT1XM55_9SPHN|nr:GGDEF domain-containing protein [Parerythrobacter lacustris]MCR2832753.1 GGDEF domain-containing protein [Parerythrobacter lacustris]
MINATQREPNPPHTGLLGWLGLGRAGAVAVHRTGDVSGTGRQAIVARIGAFLAEHDLEVTPANLAVAHGVVSGLNPRLERRIRRMEETGQRISQEWLRQAVAGQGADDRSIDLLAQRLEKGIDDFSRSTVKVRSTTQCYGDALESHMGELNARPDPGKVITDLAAFAGVMLERTRKAEASLQESEEEAAALRRNLELARRDADYDFLTGLPNRRAFESRLEEEIAAARAANEPLCVAFCDIDHFKRVNDTHGHEAGDRIICVVGKTLSDLSGERCHVARHGGEEFVVLLRGLALEDARDLLDGQRRALSERKLVNRRTEQAFGRITFSGGVADVFAYSDACDALAAADEALYEAKESGRNQIRAAGPRA